MLCQVTVPPYAMERDSDICCKLLGMLHVAYLFEACRVISAPWKVPVALNEDVLRLAIHLRTLVTNDKGVFPHRQFK